MLKKKNGASPQNVDTIIGKNAYFEGTFKTSGLLRIDGVFDGDIIIEGDLIVGREGRISGSVKANNIEISGEIEGNIYSSDQVKISSSGKLFGDIEVGSFVVEEKGIFDGKCKMINDNAPISLENKKQSGIKSDQTKISSSNKHFGDIEVGSGK